ncbi:hypothetical protein K440DRAFT_95052 [Wilcoxina mikolae CBS 423.85]|nr:hypothetical protein K440DRAFT_95052 [Wilcoxina mikolae CBS 423.85]
MLSVQRPSKQSPRNEHIYIPHGLPVIHRIVSYRIIHSLSSRILYAEEEEEEGRAVGMECYVALPLTSCKAVHHHIHPPPPPPGHEVSRTPIAIHWKSKNRVHDSSGSDVVRYDRRKKPSRGTDTAASCSSWGREGGRGVQPNGMGRYVLRNYPQ